MPDYRIVVAAAVVVVLVAVVVVGRLMARRAETGARLTLVGDQPEATIWLPKALQAASARSPWPYEIYPISTPGGPPETRGEATSPSGDGLVTVRVDSSRASGTFTAEDPVRVVVRASEAAPPTGLTALLFGAALTPTGRMQARVVRAIKRQNGAAPKPEVVPGAARPPRHRRPAPLGSRTRGRGIVVAALVAVLLAGGVLIGVRALTGADLLTGAKPTPTATLAKPPARPAKPKGAKTACAVKHQLKAGPKYSAVNDKAPCGFAENVRQAYVKKNAIGKKVSLTKVSDPSAKKTYTVKCESQKPVVCRGGAKKGAITYLYG